MEIVVGSAVIRRGRSFDMTFWTFATAPLISSPLRRATIPMIVSRQVPKAVATKSVGGKRFATSLIVDRSIGSDFSPPTGRERRGSVAALRNQYELQPSQNSGSRFLLVKRRLARRSIASPAIQSPTLGRETESGLPVLWPC